MGARPDSDYCLKQSELTANKVIMVRSVPLILRVEVILTWMLEKHHVNTHRVQGHVLLLKGSAPTT